jgi:ABC-type sugar transport system substrate-binding protein
VTGSLRSSAAQQRLEGLKAGLKSGVTLHDTEAGDWTEEGGARAFESWYALFRSRRFELHAIAAQSDELAVGARRAALAAAAPAHRAMLAGAKLLGVDACPGYGKRLVDEGTLAASVVAPANTGDALRRLHRFWEAGQPVALRAFTRPLPYPPSSVGS